MLTRAANILEEACRKHEIPGAVLRVDVNGEIAHVSAHGVTRFDKPAPVIPPTWFDLASLTKILGTTPAVMLLHQQRRIDLEAPLSEYLADLNSALRDVPLSMFLAHRSGLAAWRNFYQQVPADRLGSPTAKAIIRNLHLQEKPVYEPGSMELYSDIGMALVGFAVETITGQDLNRFVTPEILDQAAPDEIAYLQISPRSVPSIAATEDCRWRGRILVGEVHDENTWAAGGCLGQSGLFGSAAGAARIMEEFRQALLGQGKIFQPSTIKSFMIKHGRRRLGFDAPDFELSSTGTRMGLHTFGHLGYTGCSAWCDPERSITIVLLTNRVHPSRGNEAHKRLRPQVHDAVMEELSE